MDTLVINIITQDFISRKITRPKICIYIIGRNRGPAKTIFGQRSGPAMAGPAVPPTTALPLCPSIVKPLAYKLPVNECIYFKCNYKISTMHTDTPHAFNPVTLVDIHTHFFFVIFFCYFFCCCYFFFFSLICTIIYNMK